MPKYPSLICIMTGGELYQIHVDGVWILFEDHHYCGPMPLDKRTLDERKLGPRHHFWAAVSAWYLGGKKTGREKKLGRGIVKYCEP